MANLRCRAWARALLFGVLAFTVSFGPARADVPSRVFAARGQYLPGDNENKVPAVLLAGNTLVFENLDPTANGDHTFTADDTNPNGDPLFDTGHVAVRQEVALDLSDLPAGMYGFHCNIHLMFGTLCVASADPNSCTFVP